MEGSLSPSVVALLCRTSDREGFRADGAQAVAHLHHNQSAGIDEIGAARVLADRIIDPGGDAFDFASG